MTWLCLRNDDYRNSQMCIVTTSKLLEKQKHQAVEELAAAAEADNDQGQMKCINDSNISTILFVTYETELRRR
jgi:hypothetical protein